MPEIIVMTYTLEIVVGAMVAGLLIAVFHRVRFDRALRFWAQALVVASAIYVGFVLVGDAPIRSLLVEAGGLVLFVALAILGVRYSPWVLAGAWFAHIAWDALLHSHNTTFVPQWYPAACIGFDLIVGVYIIAMYSQIHTTTNSN